MRVGPDQLAHRARDLLEPLGPVTHRGHERVEVVAEHEAEITPRRPAALVAFDTRDRAVLALGRHHALGAVRHLGHRELALLAHQVAHERADLRERVVALAVLDRRDIAPGRMNEPDVVGLVDQGPAMGEHDHREHLI